MKHILLTVAYFLLLGVAHAAEPSTASVAAAAKRFSPATDWMANSVATGDFTCEGRVQHAILGRSRSGVVVAIFTNQLKSKPQLLRFEPDPRAAEGPELQLDDLSFEDEDFWKEVSSLAPGLRKSKTCKGLSIHGGERDALHIFWNLSRRRFETWSF